MEVKNINTDKLKDISFKLHHGEILGFAGLVGAGRTEIARAIFGADKISSGEIIVEGKPVHIKKPGDAIAAGTQPDPGRSERAGRFAENDGERRIISMVTLKRISKFLGC